MPKPSAGLPNHQVQPPGEQQEGDQQNPSAAASQLTAHTPRDPASVAAMPWLQQQDAFAASLPSAQQPQQPAGAQLLSPLLFPFNMPMDDLGAAAPPGLKGLVGAKRPFPGAAAAAAAGAPPRPARDALCVVSLTGKTVTLTYMAPAWKERLMPYHVVLTKPLARGGYAWVWEGTLRRTDVFDPYLPVVTDDGPSQLVAVKLLYDTHPN